MAVAKRPNKAKKAENENASEAQDEFGGKEYERELARLHGSWSSCSSGSSPRD